MTRLGLEDAAVYVVRYLARVEKPRGRAEPEVIRTHDEHVELGAQLHRDEIDERFLAAVGVEHDELTHPAARHAAADIEPKGHDSAGRGAQCAV